MRAGEVLEPALLSVCKEATIGKILIQTNDTTDEPAVSSPQHIDYGVGHDTFAAAFPASSL